MTKTTIFTNNKSRAVRIPKALEFPEGVKKVSVILVGDSRLITPADSSWDSWFDELAVSSDFLEERDQPQDQQRESL